MEHIIGKFEKLFSIKIMHPWFKNNVCTFLKIEPDLETKNIFKNRHLIIKSHPGEINIITEINEKTENNKIVKQPKYASGNDHHFVFFIKLSDYKFLEITKLDLSGFPKHILFFSNNSKNTKLSVEKCFIAEKILSVDFNKGKVPVSESILTNDNTEIFHININKEATGFKHDLSDCKSGVYTLKTEFGKADKTQNQKFYYSSIAREESIFGVVDIDVSSMNTVNDDKNNFIVFFEKNEIK